MELNNNNDSILLLPNLIKILGIRIKLRDCFNHALMVELFVRTFWTKPHYALLNIIIKTLTCITTQTQIYDVLITSSVIIFNFIIPQRRPRAVSNPVNQIGIT